MIKEFKLPKWEDFPEEKLFNKEMAEYVNNSLSDILDEENFVTNTKIQNYVKWDMIPKPIGRKYGKTHIAMLMTITFLKEVLSIPEVKKGIDLSLELMSPEDAYNTFVDMVGEAFKNIKESLENGNERFIVKGFSSTSESLAIDAAVYSLALKYFAKEVLKADGLKNYLSKKINDTNL